LKRSLATLLLTTLNGLGLPALDDKSISYYSPTTTMHFSHMVLGQNVFGQNVPGLKVRRQSDCTLTD